MSTGVMQPAATPDAVAPDPSKHVNYTFGMLLGVDDFKQEFAYLAGRGVRNRYFPTTGGVLTSWTRFHR